MALTYWESLHCWAPRLRPIAVSQMMSRAQWVTWGMGELVGKSAAQEGRWWANYELELRNGG